MAGSNYVDVNSKAVFGPHEAGTHVTISTTDTTLDDVTSGDLVLAGQLIGIAIADYNEDTDFITLDTMGCYKLSVDGKDKDGASVAVAVGDWLYYDPVAASINRDFVNGVCIGRALEAVGSGLTAVIGVQIIPIPWDDIKAYVTASAQ
jgi:predicted RecA/RadA family phage recombinase